MMHLQVRCQVRLTVQGGAGAQGEAGKHWDKKGASRRADVVGALRAGLDRLAEVSCSALQRVGSSDLLQRFWVCLEARPCLLHALSDADATQQPPRALCMGAARAGTFLLQAQLLICLHRGHEAICIWWCMRSISQYIRIPGPAGVDVSAAELPASRAAREGAAAHGAQPHAGARQGHGLVAARPPRQPGHHGTPLECKSCCMLTLYERLGTPTLLQLPAWPLSYPT